MAAKISWHSHWLTDCIYSPQNTHNIAQAFKITTTEAGCQRGTNTYQCWPPLQLKDTIQGPDFQNFLRRSLENLRKILRSFENRAPDTQMHKKRRKEKNTASIYKLTRVRVQKKISCCWHNTLSPICSGVARNFRQGVRQSVAFLSVHSRSAALCVGL